MRSRAAIFMLLKLSNHLGLDLNIVHGKIISKQAE